jgi:phosphoethanolamine N-methyltransferase
VDFRVADVTQLTLAPGSYDVVFSNWLLMYLSDEEVYNLACAAISWVSEGCHSGDAFGCVGDMLG